MADTSRERATEPEIATTTLAEIYVQQGLLERALAIYRRVAERTPNDPRIASRLTELEREFERVRVGAEPAVGLASPAPPAAESASEPPASVSEPPASASEPPASASEPPASAGSPGRAAPPVDEDAAFLAWLATR